MNTLQFLFIYTKQLSTSSGGLYSALQLFFLYFLLSCFSNSEDSNCYHGGWHTLLFLSFFYLFFCFALCSVAQFKFVIVR